jgi:uncharacterized protein YndB with AHSA1/START domain
VNWVPELAFRRFTTEMAKWWPLHTHSVSQQRARTVVFEPHAGGRIYEEDEDGARYVWGTVLEWSPPGRVRFTWHPGREEATAGEVDVRFVAEGKGTVLELVHMGWERLGRRAAGERRGYTIGWIPVLDRWAGRSSVAGTAVNALIAMVLAVRGRRSRAAGEAQRSPAAPSTDAAGVVGTAQNQGSSRDGP